MAGQRVNASPDTKSTVYRALLAVMEIANTREPYWDGTKMVRVRPDVVAIAATAGYTVKATKEILRTLAAEGHISLAGISGVTYARGRRRGEDTVASGDIQGPQVLPVASGD